MRHTFVKTFFNIKNNYFTSELLNLFIIIIYYIVTRDRKYAILYGEKHLWDKIL